MIKPLNINDHEHQSFQIILKTLTAQDVEYMQGEAGEINLLLGDYQQVINDNLEDPNGLVKDRLIQLVFALECTGRKKEAIKILSEYPEAAENSDIMGVIGGRHKRNFLLSGLKKDAAMAFQYYEKGLEMAKAKPDPKQIFYHAINLAFLKITVEKDEAEMKRYAQLALDNCVSQKKDKWELATVAEANLYLGNTELATAFYKEAAKLANARDRQSIYSNAFNGYQSLTADTAKDAAFIKMLDDTFLKNKR